MAPSSLLNHNFNISHHGSYVVLLHHPEWIVGVDVTELSVPDGLSIEEYSESLHSQFSRDEWLFLSSLTENYKLKYLMSLWALKEAFVKAIGKGIVEGLKNINFKSQSQPHDLSFLKSFTLDVSILPLFFFI